MSRVVYNNVPYNTKDGVGVVILDDTMPPNIRKQWEDILKGFSPTSASFIPEYRLVFASDGFNTWPIDNDNYFATMDTAKEMAKRYGINQIIVEVPFGGSGGMYTVSENEYHINLANGDTLNAGILADFFRRNPEDTAPGVADKLIRGQLANRAKSVADGGVGSGVAK